MVTGIAHAVSLADGCLARNDWLCGAYLRTRAGELGQALGEHVYLTVVSVAVGAVIALPLALVARRWRRAESGILGVATAIYTIPSLALFSLLLGVTGLSPTTVIIGLVLYSLTVLVRGTIAGLDAVPGDVKEAAAGMGYGSGRMLLRVELPLALPAIFAGLRVATVSTVALTTIGAVVGYGGLGNLILGGLTSFFKAQVLAASVLCVLLALAADLLLVGVERALTPWRRGTR